MRRQLIPTWKGILPLLLHARIHGAADHRQIAEAELVRMAEAADEAAACDDGDDHPQFALAFEDGNFCGMVTSRTSLVGTPYVTIDYDVEGIEPEKRVKFQTNDGKEVEAYVREHKVGASNVPVGKLETYEPADIDPAEVAWRAQEPMV